MADTFSVNSSVRVVEGFYRMQRQKPPHARAIAWAVSADKELWSDLAVTALTVVAIWVLMVV